MKNDSLPEVNKWTSPDHVETYLSRTKKPHEEETRRMLLEEIPADIERVLDLGTGDGRLLMLVKSINPTVEGVALDFSEPMLELAGKRFSGDPHVAVIKHDLNDPLPADRLGCFDLVISGLAIHHLNDERKRQLYTEIFDLLNSGGLFCNLEHVSSPTQALHEKFLSFIGLTRITDDPSNKLLDVETQLRWLREIGFEDVDCIWKWREIAIMTGYKPK